MAHSQLQDRVPLKAASAMGANMPIGFLLGGSALSETIRLAATTSEFPFGLTSATVASPGDPISYWQPGDVGKGIAGASLGAGCLVGVGSTNGVLAPVAPVAAGATGPPRYAVGVSLKNAAAADVFPVFIKPDQVI